MKRPRSKTQRALARISGIALLCLGLTACAARQDPSHIIVTDIHFDGNDDWFQGTADYNLRAAMDQKESSWAYGVLPWVNGEVLDPLQLLQDAWRLENWYAHHGYFDARVMGWDVRIDERRLSPDRAEIVGQVKQGEPTLIRKVEYKGLQKAGDRIVSEVDRLSESRKGDRFNLEAVEETAAYILAELRGAGFFYATVEPKVNVEPEKQSADVTFRVRAGPRCKIGTVEITGVETIPPRMLEEEILVVAGERYDARLVAETRTRIFALGAFSSVRLVPKPRADDERTIDIEVAVSEAPFRRLRTGFGFGWEEGQQDGHISTEYRHANLFGALEQLDLGAKIGYASQFERDTSQWDSSDVTPLLDLSTELTWPRVWGRHWRVSQEFAWVEDLKEAYRFASPTISYVVGDKFTLALSYDLTYVDNIDLDALDGFENLGTAPEGRLADILAEAFWESSLSLSFSRDARDDALFTRNGTYSEATVEWGGGPLGGAYDFVKGNAELCLYRPIDQLLGRRFGVVAAGRVGLGAALPLGTSSAIPYSERFRIGGGTTIRGWRPDFAGPFLIDENPGEILTVADSTGLAPNQLTPIGGESMAYANIEARRDLPGGLGVVGFMDIGMAWDRLEDTRLTDLVPSVGTGFRYRSPVGPARIDFALLLDENAFQQAQRWNVHFALAEAF